MSKPQSNIEAAPVELQEGILICGQILNCQDKQGKSKTGNDYHMRTYMVLCGRKIVSVQQTNVDTAPLHPDGTKVVVEIEPSWKDNGVIIISGDVKSV